MGKKVAISGKTINTTVKIIRAARKGSIPVNIIRSGISGGIPLITNTLKVCHILDGVGDWYRGYRLRSFQGDFHNAFCPCGLDIKPCHSPVALIREMYLSLIG